MYFLLFKLNDKSGRNKIKQWKIHHNVDMMNDIKWAVLFIDKQFYELEGNKITK